MELQQENSAVGVEQDVWVLDTDQMVFMLQHHNFIEEAFAHEDLDGLRRLAESADFKRLFGTMSFDEAHDRYECIE